MSKANSYKVPPQDIEAERFILGGILLEPEAISKLIEILTHEDFYHSAHQLIYRCMLELYEKNEPQDVITLTNILKRAR